MRGMILLGENAVGSRVPLSPTETKEISPAWKEEIKKFAPWVKICLQEEGVRGEHWITEIKRAKSAVFLCGMSTSSLDVAWNLAEQNLIDPWDSVLVEGQLKGRGQLKRQWISPPGNLYGALCLPGDAIFSTSLASLVTGYVCVQGLRAMGIQARLKWPNDLVLGGKKIGGILIEERRGRIMAGVGLNLKFCPPENDLRASSAMPAGTLSEFGYELTPVSGWNRLVEIVQFCYQDTLLSARPIDLMSQIQELMEYMGHVVTVHGHGQDAIIGRVLGLDPHGGLRLKAADSEIIIHSGSLLPVPESNHS